MFRVDIIDNSPVYCEGLASILLRHGAQVRCLAPTRSIQVRDVGDVTILGARSLPYLEMNTSTLLGLGARHLLIVTDGEPGGELSVQRMRRIGARGAVDRNASIHSYITAIRAVSNGGEFWNGREHGDASKSATPFLEVHLTPREQEVLSHIASGRTHSQTARRLGISSYTVDTYIKRIRAKLGPANKAELTRIAMLGGAMLGNYKSTG